MKFALCSSSLDMSNLCFEGLRCNTASLPLNKPFLGFGFLAKNENVQESYCNSKRMVISSHLLPGHLEGSFMGKKRLEEPSRKLEFVRTLLIDNYDSYTYNIYQELSVVNGVPPVVVKNDEWTWEEVCHYLYEEKAFDNIVISPGPGSPTCAVDIGICLRLLLECRDIPILGICLGHQALGYAHGAQIVHASEPVHGRMSEIEHNGCRLFNNIPSGKKSGFKVVRYHSLVIDAESLPKELVPIAWTTSTGTHSFLESQNSDLIPDACESQIRPEKGTLFFYGGKGGQLWKQITFRLSDQSDMAFKDGGYLSVEYAQGTTRSMYLEKGFLDFLNQELLSFRYDEKDFEGLPFDFYGGYIGYIGYNLKVECGMLSNRYKSKTPDACFFFADNFIVIDHRYDDVYIMSIQEGNTANTPWLDDVEQKLLHLEASAAKKLGKQPSQPAKFSPCKAGFLAEKLKEQYINDVHKCLEYIKDGESYELCLTTQIRKRVGDIDSLGLYLHLREKNPAPYAAWLNFSNENLCICCSSPERFLRLNRNGVLEAKPIKGTMARGATQEEDEQLKLQLQCSEKDQAENLMIVDLLRNDLGRVCEPGSVHVPCLMDVESYATVHTMVSTIRGKKRSNVNAVDCSIGFFSYNQTFDLNIVIRTIVMHEGEASIGAGGAIVALSNPEDEYDEMILKTNAPAKAVVEFQ
ncbi:hypothetical protein GH714_008851 [Hevea brasiliensis]|uniref:aminodeoxychorismate synthase n=1 Tax=Hevea brasiliensis TaxID=3981 RepID=A0A6A6MYK7_HEVBR|nr:hypothetical protein GH714_008851 [Hevea brasiliensis]